jgi:hypothetical protein
MRRLLLTIGVLLCAGAGFAQDAVTLPPGSNTLKSLHLKNHPGLGIYEFADGVLWIGTNTAALVCTDNAGCTFAGPVTFSFEGTTDDDNETVLAVTDPTADRTITFPDASGTVLLSSSANEINAANAVWAGGGAFVYEGSTADTSETTIGVVDPTDDRTISFPDQSGYVVLNPFLTADAAIQFGSTVMPDAGTDGRFDVTGANGTNSIGVYGATNMTGPTVQHTAYPVVMNGVAYVRPAEDTAIVRGHHLLQSATAGAVSDNAVISTDGLNIGLALYSEPVTNVINNAGCTGGAGCVNTAVDTPNTGPAGQITLSADVAAAGWTVGQPVIYWNSGGTSIAGLTDGNVYFLASVSTTNVTLSATKGGAVIVPTTQGDDATQYLQRLPLAAIAIR